MTESTVQAFLKLSKTNGGIFGIFLTESIVVMVEEILFL